jgi:hypothetical protein
MNLFDWDFSMYLKELCPYINPREYKTWRSTGLAFEYRLTENKIPNRTFASYIPGYNVSKKQSCFKICLEEVKRQDFGTRFLG